MKHRIVTAAQMKEIERAGDAHGLPYLQMMENAGLAAYAELQKQFPHPGRLLVVCGKGNNGGDCPRRSKRRLECDRSSGRGRAENRGFHPQF